MPQSGTQRGHQKKGSGGDGMSEEGEVEKREHQKKGSV